MQHESIIPPGWVQIGGALTPEDLFFLPLFFTGFERDKNEEGWPRRFSPQLQVVPAARPVDAAWYPCPSALSSALAKDDSYSSLLTISSVWAWKAQMKKMCSLETGMWNMCIQLLWKWVLDWFLWTSHFLSGIFNQNIWVVRLCSPEAIDQNTYQTPRWFHVCHHFASQLNECWTSLINLRLVLFYHPLRIVVMSYSRPQVFVLVNYKSTVFGRLSCVWGSTIHMQPPVAQTSGQGKNNPNVVLSLSFQCEIATHPW